MTRYQVSYSSFAPPQEPGLQPYFARGAYQRRNSTSGCLFAPLRGLCRHCESATRFPSTHFCGPLRSIRQRETLGVHSFRPGGAAGGRRRRRTCRGLCLWPSRRRRPRLDCHWSSWRWPGDLRCPRAVPTETRGRIQSRDVVVLWLDLIVVRAPAGVRPTVLRASTAPGKPHRRRAASGRTRRPPAAPAARRLRERIPPARPRTSHPLLRLMRRSRRRRAEPPPTHRLAPKT